MISFVSGTYWPNCGFERVVVERCVSIVDAESGRA
jgi:hypothetical protein